MRCAEMLVANAVERWADSDREALERGSQMTPPIAVGVIGDFDPAFEPHVATDAGVGHAAAAAGFAVTVEWLATDRLAETPGLVEQFDALICAPGSPYKNMDGALHAVRHAREHDLPLLGTCGGFQHVVLEYARNVLGLTDAQHAEYDPYASLLFVTPLSCSVAGQTMEVSLDPSSGAAAMYGRTLVEERYYCNFGLNPEYGNHLEEAGLRISGVDANGEARIVELPGHPYFLATLFVPQSSSQPGAPHALLSGLLAAADRERAGSAVG
jgi:CTP synthase (UTP-ammonia lyase)